MNPDAKPKGPVILGLDETSALRTAMYVTGESTVCVDRRPVRWACRGVVQGRRGRRGREGEERE